MSGENQIRAKTAFLMLALPMISAFAQEGVTSSQILIGQACAMSGPAKDLGYELKAGAEACFAHVNRHGGVNGRKIKLVSLDDSHYPPKTLEVTKQLLGHEKVFALFGYVGTSTSAAVIPLTKADNAPFFAPYSGAEFFRTPVMSNVYNIRAGYLQEIELMVRELVDVLGKKSIAVFYQDDAYGKAGLAGVQNSLRQRGLEISAAGAYERHSVDVRAGFAAIQMAKPNAVILIGAAKASAAFIKTAKIAGLKCIFLNLSFVDGMALAKELGSDGDSVIVTQAVPLPWDSSVPLVGEYQTNLRRYLPGAEFGFSSLEGYLSAKVLVQGLRNAGKKLTRASLCAALDGMKSFDCGGVTVSFGPEDHQGLDHAYLTIIENGAFKQVRSLRHSLSHKR
jgi:ABC-type branched-subunit amino acid transport system substrate-binding protein